MYTSNSTRARESLGDNGVVITYPETSDGPLAPRCRQESSRFSRHPGEGDKNGDAAEVHTIDLAQRRRWRSGSSFMVLVSEGRKEGLKLGHPPTVVRPTSKEVRGGRWEKIYRKMRTSDVRRRDGRGTSL